MNYQKILSILQTIMTDAGHLFETDFRGDFKRWEKGEGDWVSAVDIEIQNYLISALSKEFPSFHFMAEEQEASRVFGRERTWIIDPIDGTNNYIHGIPQCCISVALYQERSPLLAAVYQPIGSNWYTAIKGEGAWFNGARLYVSSNTELKRAVVFLGMHLTKQPDFDIWNFLCELEDQTQALRRFGSLALDSCLIAEQRGDLMITTRSNPWDIAASLLIVKEAGGKVTDFQGREDPTSRYLLFSNGGLHEAALALIQSHLTPSNE
jgi:myo-inositol-1(or 4)-monophosphatase